MYGRLTGTQQCSPHRFFIRSSMHNCAAAWVFRPGISRPDSDGRAEYRFQSALFELKSPIH
jgi:hypothetical protein